MQGVVIGERMGHNEVAEYPTIEDGVWVGPYAIINGGINVGADADIAGGCFVTHDVAPLSVMVGNPARLLLRREAEARSALIAQPA